MRQLVWITLLASTLSPSGCTWLGDLLFDSIVDHDRPTDPAVLDRLGYTPGSREAGRLEAEENNARRASEY